MIKIFSTSIIVTVTALIIIIAFGFYSPSEFTAVETRILDESKEDVWRVLTEITKYPERKNDVINIELLEKEGKYIRVWRENLKFGGYRVYKIKEKEPDSRFVLEITDSRDTKTGIWTYILNENEKQTNVTIKEESQQPNVFWRGLSVIKGRNSLISHEFKWIRVALFQKLLNR